MRKKLIIILFALLLILGLPLSIIAAENHEPTYVGEKTQIDLEPGEVFFTTNDEISHWFRDEDGDSLTYWVKVGNSRYIEIKDKCMYDPDGEESVTLTFKANDGTADSEEVALPIKFSKRTRTNPELLSSLIIHRKTAPAETTILLKSDDETYTSGQIFNPEVYEYTLEGVFYDTEPLFGFRATCDSEKDIILTYQGNLSKSIKITGEKEPSKTVQNMLTAGKNKIQIRVGDLGQIYTVNIDAIPTLKALSTKGVSYWNKKFDSSKTKYTIELPKDEKTLEFSAECYSEGCTVTYNGQESSIVDISDPNCKEVLIKVSKDGISNTYTMTLDRKPVYELKFKTNPEDALVTVSDHLGNKIQPNTEGIYRGLFGEHEYKYVVSLEGYKTVEGIVPTKNGEISFNLEKLVDAQPEEVTAEWKNFRGNDNHMAIVSTELPTSKVAAKWTQKLGSGYSDAPSVQIIVDNTLVVLAGKTIYKLDMETGDVLQSAEMVEKINWGYTPPSYGGGMIFCPLANGTIQAFNAKTLESLWVYKDSIGGQSLSPITYADGYIYTGFWTSETKEANFVCINVTDEDTTKINEVKKARWFHKQKGGFYWAGSIVIGNAVIVGTDDGQQEGTYGKSMLYAFDKLNGEILSSAELPGAGDQRSSIAFDSVTNRIYFTTKGGYLCSAAVNTTTGKFSDLKKSYFGMQSTSTPVVYKNRVYFGVGQGFGNGYLAVADVNTLDILFKIKMKGYPQGSVLMSTAYEDTGYLYLYLSYNSPPGGISMIKVKTNCNSEADAVLTEIYDASGYSQYCITSLICDKNGTIYYKNDSATVFAVGKPSYQNVMDKIDAIGTVTADSEDKVLSVREAYDALSSADKLKVTNYSKLTAAEEALEELLMGAIKEVEALITKIGNVTIHSRDKIEAARKAYDKLTVIEKQKVTNYKTLTTAESTYKTLVNKAVEEVENLINAIGTVTKDSKTAITKARNAYEQLSEELQNLVGNYADLQKAEKAFEKLTEISTTTALATASAASNTSTAQTTVTSKKTVSKPELLQLQEQLNSIDSNMDYENALSLIKNVYSLEEKDRLAFEETEGMKTLQNIIAEHVHVDENTGISVDGLPWNIAVAVTTTDTERVFEDVEERMTSADVLGVWEIHLEDIINGQNYTLEDTIKLRIPKELFNKTNNYGRIAIIHYNEVAEIEVLNTTIEDEYLECDVVEFSYYAVAGFVDGDEAIQDETTEGKTNMFTGVIWLLLAVVGIAVLTIVAYLRFVKKEEEEVDEIVGRNTRN